MTNIGPSHAHALRVCLERRRRAGRCVLDQKAARLVAAGVLGLCTNRGTRRPARRSPPRAAGRRWAHTPAVSVGRHRVLLAGCRRQGRNKRGHHSSSRPPVPVNGRGRRLMAARGRAGSRQDGHARTKYNRHPMRSKCSLSGPLSRCRPPASSTMNDASPIPNGPGRQAGGFVSPVSSRASGRAGAGGSSQP